MIPSTTPRRCCEPPHGPWSAHPWGGLVVLDDLGVDHVVVRTPHLRGFRRTALASQVVRLITGNGVRADPRRGRDLLLSQAGAAHPTDQFGAVLARHHEPDIAVLGLVKRNAPYPMSGRGAFSRLRGSQPLVGIGPSIGTDARMAARIMAVATPSLSCTGSFTAFSWPNIQTP